MKKWMGIVLLCLPLVANAGAEREGDRMEKYMTHLQERLQLDDKQASQVREIMAEHHAQMRESRENMKSRMREVLNPEQQEKLQAMHEARKKAWRDKHQRDGKKGHSNHP